MTDIPLADGPEFDRVREIAATLGPQASGLGDDCAVMELGGEFLVVSTDVSVEGVHFRREWISAEEIGWRAAAAALSDIAAEGATPIGVLAAVSVPRSAPGSDTSEIMRGVGGAAADAGATVLGGDLSSGTMLSITVTALGRTSRPVSRVGAEPGDGIWVTGALGGARAALEAFQAGRDPDPAARSAFVRPPSRHAAGVWLGAHGVHAMLDLSDGLGADAPHLAAASGVAIVVDVERTPVSGPAAAAAVANGIEASLYAAVGGEDYELLAALPPEFENGGPAQFERETGLAITRVGEARRGRGVRFQLRGQKVTIDGFDHFR